MVIRLVMADHSPHWAFGTVIVNHTAGNNQLVCAGANAYNETGGYPFPIALILDPTEHGEVNAIRNCVKMFTERGLSPAEIKLAWKELSLYTVSIFCIF